jgi:Spy/CpxP family protein refolding chaperone
MHQLGRSIAAGMIAAVAALPVSAAPPYPGLEGRKIKALGTEEVEALRAGRGMGLALAAELNGYPGPRHVLEHADALALSDRQRTETERLFREMQARAVLLGKRIIEEEVALDRLFAHRQADAAAVADRTAAIARLGGELRAHHLGYHLAMVDLLSPAQIERYAELRGYAADRHATGSGHGGHR